jgi:hypothetical protein
MKKLGLYENQIKELKEKVSALKKELDEMYSPTIVQYGRNNLWFEYEKCEGSMGDIPYYGEVRLLKKERRDKNELEVIASFDVAFLKEFLKEIGEL